LYRLPPLFSSSRAVDGHSLPGILLFWDFRSGLSFFHIRWIDGEILVLRHRCLASPVGLLNPIAVLPGAHPFCAPPSFLPASPVPPLSLQRGWKGPDKLQTDFYVLESCFLPAYPPPVSPLNAARKLQFVTFSRAFFFAWRGPSRSHL